MNNHYKKKKHEKTDKRGAFRFLIVLAMAIILAAIPCFFLVAKVHKSDYTQQQQQQEEEQLGFIATASKNQPNRTTTSSPFISSSSSSSSSTMTAKAAAAASAGNERRRNNQGEFSRFAYAFVIAGCNPAAPIPTYRYYLYNVLVANQLLREAGSQHDIVVFIQLDATYAAAAATNPPQTTTLPEMDTFVLLQQNQQQQQQQESSSHKNRNTKNKSGKQEKRGKIRILYIPVSTKQSFYRTVMEKFRILSLTEYEQVLFMDSDIMPLTNLDYLFSQQQDDQQQDQHGETGAPLLQPNLVLQGIHEPAHGGFFVLQTAAAAVASTTTSTMLQDFNAILARRVAEGRRIGPPTYFDPVQGWGHVFGKTTTATTTTNTTASSSSSIDEWQSAKEPHGRNWTFWAAFADQGLLYYWTKYHQRAVSIVTLKGTVQNWGILPPDETTTTTTTTNRSIRPAAARGADAMIGPEQDRAAVQLLATVENPWLVAHKRNAAKDDCIPRRVQCALPPPYSDFVHFTGRRKPWLKGPPLGVLTREESFQSPRKYWWYTLQQIILQEYTNGTNGIHHNSTIAEYVAQFFALAQRNSDNDNQPKHDQKQSQQQRGKRTFRRDDEEKFKPVLGYFAQHEEALECDRLDFFVK